MLSREAAFLALLQWAQKGTFLWDSLQEYKERYRPDTSDLNFAYELSCGSCRMMRHLDTVAKAMTAKLPKKPKERILLRLGLYQRIFCPNIPLYAVVDSMVELAKKYTYREFSAFLNAVLRKELPQVKMTLAEETSYTDYFVDSLVAQHGLETATSILKQQNLPTSTIKVSYNNGEYIQNRTQLELLEKSINQLTFYPKTILDLCAAPGGKTLYLHKKFPNAKLVANDKAKGKIPLLKQTLERFACPAEISCMDGTNFSWPHTFDLIVVDAPCSNSGVLYNCPEARWRLEKEELVRLQDSQVKLVTSAFRHLSEQGKIIYQTCSILRQEHEELLKTASTPFVQLPDNEGHEGGFSCIL